MRYPTTHNFLKWFGPTVVIFAGGCVGLVAALAQSYSGVRDWGQQLFESWWPFVSAPWFLFAAAVVIAAYIWALVWTGRDKPRMPMTISPEALGRASMSPRAFSPSDAWMRKGLEDELEKQSLDRKAKWAVDRAAASAARTKAWLGPDFETLEDRVARQKSERTAIVTWWPLHQALHYLVYDSQWAQVQPAPTDRNDFDKRVSTEFLERLARGEIEARGKLGWTQESLNRPTEPIERGYWVSAFMQPHGEIVLASPDTQGAVGSKASDKTYRSVIVQKGQVETAWPRGTGAGGLPPLAQFVEPLRVQIAEEKGNV